MTRDAAHGQLRDALGGAQGAGPSARTTQQRHEREPLGQEGIRGDAERRVMMKAPPASALEVIQPQLVLQFLAVAFDPPPQHGELNEFHGGRRRRQCREPVLDRGRFRSRPFDQQPLFGARADRQSSRWAGPHADRRKARPHGAPRAWAPRHRAPRGRRQLLRHGGHTQGTVAPRPPNQRRGPTHPAILPGGQGRPARRPHARLGADPHDVRDARRRQASRNAVTTP